MPPKVPVERKLEEAVFALGALADVVAEVQVMRSS
jgi:hypothetical protein